MNQKILPLRMLYWRGMQSQFMIKCFARQATLQADAEYVKLCISFDGQALRQLPPLDWSKNWYSKTIVSNQQNYDDTV